MLSKIGRLDFRCEPTNHPSYPDFINLVFAHGFISVQSILMHSISLHYHTTYMSACTCIKQTSTGYTYPNNSRPEYDALVVSESNECLVLDDVPYDPPHHVVRHQGDYLPHNGQQTNLNAVGNLLRPIALRHRLLTWKEKQHVSNVST